MEKKIELTMEEKIDRAKEGRSQNWIVLQMIKRGIKINEVQFSRKKKGAMAFSREELFVLSDILNTDLMPKDI